MYMPTLYLDDGHGGKTPGKRTPKFKNGTFIHENEFNRSVCNYLERFAKSKGFRVIQVSPEGSDTPLAIRVERANTDYRKLREQYTAVPWNKLAAYISIHYNAQDEQWGGTKGGIETYFYTNSLEGHILASFIQNNLTMGTQQVNRGTKEAGFYVIRKTNMVAILVEAGFMDNEREAKLMIEPAFQREVAIEILSGLCQYWGIRK